jgi:hypothetical protein
LNHWTTDDIIWELNRVDKSLSSLCTHVGTNRECSLGSGVDLCIFQDTIIICVEALKDKIVMGSV